MKEIKGTKLFYELMKKIPHIIHCYNMKHYQSFRIFANSICSVICEGSTAYMVWYMPNIYSTYLLGKFGQKI